jgi:hypothetical protein
MSKVFWCVAITLTLKYRYKLFLVILLTCHIRGIWISERGGGKGHVWERQRQMRVSFFLIFHFTTQHCSESPYRSYRVKPWKIREQIY